MANRVEKNFEDLQLQTFSLFAIHNGKEIKKGRISRIFNVASESIRVLICLGPLVGAIGLENV